MRKGSQVPELKWFFQQTSRQDCEGQGKLVLLHNNPVQGRTLDNQQTTVVFPTSTSIQVTDPENETVV